MNTSAKNWNRLLKGCLYTLFITTLFIYLFPIFTQSFELKITDLKFNLRSKLNYEPSMNSDIAVVEIDDNSKKESGLDLWLFSTNQCHYQNVPDSLQQAHLHNL